MGILKYNVILLLLLYSEIVSIYYDSIHNLICSRLCGHHDDTRVLRGKKFKIDHNVDCVYYQSFSELIQEETLE